MQDNHSKNQQLKTDNAEYVFHFLSLLVTDTLLIIGGGGGGVGGDYSNEFKSHY